jgi:short-subunit dehydrogenase
MGVIVNVASILGEVPQPYSAAYSMSKAAVIALGRSLRSELSLAKSPVHVVTVLPPTLDTPIFHHAGNVTGHELKALPPVYPASDAVDVILAAWRRPGKPERTVTGPGKVLVRQHRRRPVAVEAAVAKQTQVLQLGKPVPDTTGNLYAPSSAPHGVSGGWGGRRRKTGRVLLTAGLAAGLAYAIRARRSGR